MFILKLKDRDGKPLKLGDIVEISDGKNIKFFARVQWLPDQKALSPFHTFSFHSVRRVGDNVECLPDDVIQCTEPRFDCWYIPNERPDGDAAAHEHYLAEWRKCERFMESCFDIELYPPEIPGIGTVTMEGVTTTFSMHTPETIARPDITIDEFELAVVIAPAYSGLTKRKVFNDTKGQIWMTAIRDGDLWLFMWDSAKTGFTASKQISPNGFLSHGDQMRIIPDPVPITEPVFRLDESTDESVENIVSITEIWTVTMPDGHAYTIPREIKKLGRFQRTAHFIGYDGQRFRTRPQLVRYLETKP